MLPTLIEAGEHLNRLVIKKESLSRDRTRLAQSIAKGKKEAEDLVEAKNLLSEAIRLTQKQLKDVVESLVSMAIKEVFPEDNFTFVIDFVLANNKTQMKLMVKQDDDDEPFVPKDEQGGCLLDVISFALRVVFWSLQEKRTRNTFIMDEPFRWSGSLTDRVAEMMKQISKELNLQIIIVTHDERLKELADRSWTVKRNSENISVVTMIDDFCGVSNKPITNKKERRKI